MYPREFFDTYWRGDLQKEVFVAMPFGGEFDEVFKQAIKPAIENDLVGRREYSANRVDRFHTISECIHTKILDGIAHATLVFADISVMRQGPWKGQRNGNVMFELGIAQTIRPATDLIVVRSDKKEIAFDISHIRAHQYNGSNLSKARRKFADLLREGLNHRETVKRLRIQRARDRLDVDCMNLMVQFYCNGTFSEFTVGQCTAEERLAATRLLDLGIIRCYNPTGNTYRYQWTDFGKACFQHPNTS